MTETSRRRSGLLGSPPAPADSTGPAKGTAVADSIPATDGGRILDLWANGGAGSDGRLRRPGQAGADMVGLKEAAPRPHPRDTALIDAACAAAGSTFVPPGPLLEEYRGPTRLDEPLPGELLEPGDGTAEIADDEDVGPLRFHRFFDCM